MCKIDATRAVRELELKRRVKIRVVHETPGLLVNKILSGEGITAGQTLPRRWPRAHLVLIMPCGDAFGVPHGLDNVRRTVAHELIHVAQQEAIGGSPRHINHVYVHATRKGSNEFEKQADELAWTLVPLIGVTPCEFARAIPSEGEIGTALLADQVVRDVENEIPEEA